MFLFLFACHRNIGFDVQSEEVVSTWKQLLIEITDNDGIDYQTLVEKRSVLEDFLGWVGDNGPRMNRIKRVRKPRNGREQRRIAHYANAYNAWVLYEIIENQPLASAETLTLAQPQLFQNAYRVDGEYMTLHHLKEERILGTYQEPLLHMMLYEGSLSSPNLQFWSEEQLNHTLTRRMRRFLNAEKGAQKEGDAWRLSALFQREKDDFLYWSTSENLCQYLSEYAEEDLEQWLLEREKSGCILEFQPWDYRLHP